MIFAVIPAAGKSTRLGRPKLTLPVAGKTVLEHVITALRNGGVKHILVVVGPHVPELQSVAETSGAHVLVLGQETADMRDTVERGLQWLKQHFQPNTTDCWLLVPADHPTLDTAVVRQLLEARSKYPNCSIFVPTFQGQRGHPALIEWKHVPGIEKLPANQGLNNYLRVQIEETFEIAVTSAEILWDLDTPEDYERLRESGWGNIH